MKNTSPWHKKRSQRLKAFEYTREEGGTWLSFPGRFPTIRIRLFLTHFEYVEVSQFFPSGLKKGDSINFFYAGQELRFHSLRFKDPFMTILRDPDLNVFDAGVLRATNFATGWRDEFSLWEQA